MKNAIKALLILTVVSSLLTRPALLKAQSAGPDQTICQFTPAYGLYFIAHMAATGTGTWTQLSSNPVSASIFSPTNTGAIMQVYNSQPGVYGYVWTTAAGPDTMYVTVLPSPPRPVLTSTGTCFLTDSLILHGASVADSIHWWSDWGYFTATPSSDSLYKLHEMSPRPVMVATTIGANGCESMLSDTLFIIDSIPRVTIGQGALCINSSDTLFANVTYGTANNSYQWYVNGVAAGINSSRFISSTLATNDVVRVIVNNHAVCATLDTVASTGLTLTLQSLPPAPVLTLAGGNCAGSDSLILSGAGLQNHITWQDGSNVVATDYFKPHTIIGYGSQFQGNALNMVAYPSSILRDKAGNIYVDDYYNSRVMKFPPNSTQQTNGTIIAGGNGIGSGANQFNYCFGIALDTSGNLYVADYNNNRIQKFPAGSTSATNGVTVAGGNGAGSGATQLKNPGAVFVDASGNLYVSDAGNNRVQKFPPGSTSSTSATTVAGGNGSGSAANQFDVPYGLYVSAAGTLYVTDFNNSRVQKFPAGSTSATQGTTVAGGNGIGTAANQLYNPQGVTFDIHGNMYVTERYNGRVQRFPPGSTSSTNGVTVAGASSFGSGPEQLTFPNSAAIDSAGNIYIADWGNSRIQLWPQPAIDTIYHPTAAGTYTATYTAFLGCTSPPSNPIIINNCNIGSAGPDQTYCQQFVNQQYNMAATGTGSWAQLPSNPIPVTILNPNSAVTPISDFSAPGNYGFVWNSGGLDTMYFIINPTPVTHISLIGNCLGSDSILLSGAWQADSIIWYLNQNPVAYTIGSDSFYRPQAAGLYSATAISSHGCVYVGYDTVRASACTSSYTSITICAGSADTLTSMLPPDSFLVFAWLPPTGLSSAVVLNPLASPAVTTQYILTAVDTGGTLFTDTVLVVVDTLCSGYVWPGDADNNGIVDNNDILPIGLAYNFTGPVRQQQDINWYAHYANNWSDTVMGGINDKYIDCNGDGIINSSDVTAVVNNYHFIAHKTGQTSDTRSGAPLLKLVVEPDTLGNGDTMYCHILLGDNNAPANNVYGLVFTFHYEPLIIDTNTIHMSFNDSWLATQSEHITLAKTITGDGAIYAGISRINHVAKSGQGEIATATMVITTDNIDGKNMLYYLAHLGLSDVKMIDAGGNILPVNLQIDSAYVGYLPTAISNTMAGAGSVNLFPNPANNQASLVLIGADKITTVEICDITGKLVNAYNNINASHYNLSTADLAAGIYLTKVYTGSNYCVIKKFLVQH